jgi:hypothetical protein
MKKILKILGISIATILLLLIISPFLLKGKILNLVKEELNKSLNAKIEFNEDISLGLLSSFPNLRLEVEDISVVGVDTFQYDTLISANKISLDVNLMSAISGSHIKVKEVSLDEPKVNIIVLKNGMANYDIAKVDSTAEEAEVAEEESAFNLNLDKLQISNADIRYDDREAELFLELLGLNHNSSGNFKSSGFTMETSTDAESFDFSFGGMPYLVKTKLNLLADLDINLNEMRFEIQNNEILVNELKLISSGWYMLAKDYHDMDLKMEAPEIEFNQLLSLFSKELLADLESVETKGKVKFNAKAKGKMTDELLPSFDVHLQVAGGSIKYPDLPKDVHGIDMLLHTNNPGGTSDKTTVILKYLNANIGGNKVNAKMLLKTPISDPFMDVELNGFVDITDLHNSVKLENTSLQGSLTVDLEAKGHYSNIEKENYNELSAKGNLKLQDFIYKDEENGGDAEVKNMELSFSNKEVKLIDLTGKYGHSDFKAFGELRNFYAYAFGDETLYGNLNLNSNYLNLNHYLSDEEEIDDPQPEDTVALEAFDIPENLDLTLKSSIGKLIYDNLKMTNVVGNLTVRDKKIIFDQISAGMLGGTMSLSGVYDSKRPKTPFTDVSVSADKFNIQESFKYLEIMQKFGPAAQFVDGFMTAELDLTSDLDNSLTPDYSSLSGGGKLAITEGVISNLKVLNEIGDKLNMNTMKSLDVKNLVMDFKIEDGKIHLQDTMRLPVGDNTLNLLGYTKLDQSINYTGLMNIPRSQLGAGNDVLQSLTNSAKSKGLNLDLSETIPLSINIGGFVQDPKIKFNLTDSKKSLVDDLKGQLDDKKEEIVEDVKKKKEEAQRRVQDSINRVKEEQKRKILAKAQKQADETKRIAKVSADKVRKEGYANADRVENEAKGKNVLMRKAAEKSAASIRANADKKADSIVAEGDKNAKQIMDAANKKVANL